ncbi:MAG: hypothetical protein U5N86_10005 [Planctomycetota bacterium]|nr:hypothetical protein [Planctomycetota bacterium]
MTDETKRDDKPKRKVSEKEKELLLNAVRAAREAQDKQVSVWRIIRFYLLMVCLTGIIIVGFGIALVHILVYFGIQ